TKRELVHRPETKTSIQCCLLGEESHDVFAPRGWSRHSCLRFQRQIDSGFSPCSSAIAQARRAEPLRASVSRRPCAKQTKRHPGEAPGWRGFVALWINGAAFRAIPPCLSC